jgi:signal transduction histidine kinase
MKVHDVTTFGTHPRTTFDALGVRTTAPTMKAVSADTTWYSDPEQAGSGGLTIDDPARGSAPAGRTRLQVWGGAVGIALVPSLLGMLLLWAASALHSREAMVWTTAQAALLSGAGIAYLVWRLWSPSTTASEKLGLELARAESLSSRAALAETTNRRHEETLHEVRATVAGLVTAAQLLGHPDGLEPASRTRLQTMFDSELARLERLVSNRRTHEVEPVDLDAAITPLVVALRVRGHDVRWTPSGQRALGCRDDVTEVVHILLENAAHHASGAVIAVDVSSRGGFALIRVSDTGAGVPARLAGHLFERGFRRSGSQGQGIGLHVASKLTRAMGGNLVLEQPGCEGGAVFTMRLPGC